LLNTLALRQGVGLVRDLNPRRRQVLAGRLAAGAAGCLRPALCARSPLKVGVVGGGIVGAGIAMHLDDPHYRALRLESLSAYRDLDQALSLNMVWGGYVDWAGNAVEADIVRANAPQLAGSAQPARAITTARLARLDPTRTAPEAVSSHNTSR